MRIRSVDAEVLQVPLRGSLIMSIGSYAILDHVMVTLTTSEGLVGRGEATVVPEFMGESLQTILADIEAFAGFLWDVDVEDLDSVHAAMQTHRPRARSACAAVDQACHDALGRHLGVPVWRVLDDDVLNARTRFTWGIGLGTPEATVEEALVRQAAGYRTFKLKAGLDSEHDLLSVRRLRQALGPDALIRLDANGAYTPEQALSLIDRLQPYDLEMVEQPCAAAELEGMARLRRTLGVRVLVDESVFSEDDLHRVIEAAAADFVNITVQKLGGLRPSLKLAEQAAESGLGCIVGSCLEVGAGASASAHLAAVCPAVAGDSDLAAGLQNASPAAGGPDWWDGGAQLGELRGAGLGSPAARRPGGAGRC
jgi:L-Ala-D/L-Glu epimerase